MPARVHGRACTWAPSLHLFVFSSLAPCISLFSWGEELFIIMETIREKLPHVTTSKLKNIRGEGPGRWGGGRKVEEEGGGDATDDHIKPHTPYHRRWKRELHPLIF